MTPLLANPRIAPVTASVWTNTLGALVVMAYAAGGTWLILRMIGLVASLRVAADQERVGLDIAQHGEMLSPKG